ncbi:hypothetical protein DSAG12_00802 [Promethearchaeum syntrophicum]|uniref:Uncharacterized protein n=1 Tax=Promethearchaeum syntrophicum TaxID=2594042 RepID=A0A5B9D757_9ARCH|nr:hypothetical protein [Candidatus Prometheoarchaeum syntrophicum]QEE14979.1 hypothetical protein DSAG12_00802 [Candidatus Prometheoarchaeum syntrophicum]
MGEIVAVRRRKIAEEGIQRFFQSIYQILNHFKSKYDREFLYKITTEENTLTNLIIGSTTIHIYHFLGIRTKSDEEMVSRTRNIKAFQNAEKKEIFSELLDLVGDSINYELEFFKLSIDYEEQILKSMVSGEDLNERFTLKLSEQIEDHIIESLNKYPISYWIDHIGELTGYSEVVKNQILTETAGLKIIGADLERNLIEEGRRDQYLELTTFSQLIKKAKKDFEFTSIRDLKIETFPIKLMTNQIIKYVMNLYPISTRGIHQYLKATDLKKKLFAELLAANKKSTNYMKMEERILSEIKTELKNQAKLDPNDFVYFIQNLLELNFEETFALLSRLGIDNVALFCHVQNFDLEMFFEDIKLNQLSKMSFMKVGKKENELQKVEDKLNELKNRGKIKSGLSGQELVLNPTPEGDKIIELACQMANVDCEKYKQLCKKKQIIIDIIQKKYPLKGPYSCYSMVYDLPEIYQNLSRHVYYKYIEKVCRHIARVLETYIKIKEDKGLFLQGLRRIFNSTEEEEWVVVNIEELIIQRIMDRQQELSIIFNAETDAYLVNSFILARLLDIDLKSALNMLKNEPSSVYRNSAELTLPRELISPRSYIIAYDILTRFKEHQELLLMKKEQVFESNKEKKLQYEKDVQKARTLTTLNWIDKKITSGLISISATTTNPTKLYWNEKDQKITSENLKLHSELENIKICSVCGKDLTNSPCSDHPGSEKEANPVDLFASFYSFALSRIKLHWSKTKLPTYEAIYNEVLNWVLEITEKRLGKKINPEESKNLLEGERLEVSNKIASSIGIILDKALYKKFKASMKTRKN